MVAPQDYIAMFFADRFNLFFSLLMITAVGLFIVCGLNYINFTQATVFLLAVSYVKSGAPNQT